MNATPTGISLFSIMENASKKIAILSLIREYPRGADPNFPSAEIIKNPNPNKENSEIPNIDVTFHSIQ